MNVIIKINGREAIPVRALPLLAEWWTMHPQKIAGALGRVTDDDCRPLFEHLHDMNAFYVDAGAVHPMAAHHWRDHTYRNLKALSDTIKHTEITHDTGHSEWRVRALGALPKDAFVWKDEYERIYDGTYGIGSRTKESGDAHHPPVMGKGKPPVALNFSPPVEEDMQPFVQASLDAIGRSQNSAEANMLLAVAQVPVAPHMVTTTQAAATPAPEVASGDSLIPLPAVANWKMQVQTEATALVLRLRKSGANPTKHSIIDPMARWCRENGIKTDSGIYPKEGYLRVHVLGGKHWDVPN